MNYESTLKSGISNNICGKEYSPPFISRLQRIMNKSSKIGNPHSEL
jgi:hypothetical protein